MIYTTNLKSNTKIVLVFDHTTPLDIIVLDFCYSPDGDDSWVKDEKHWVDAVDRVLKDYAKIKELDYSKLSARPIELFNSEFMYVDLYNKEK